MNVRDEADLTRAVKALARACPVMRAAHKALGVPAWRTREGNYPGLARAITYQQVSTKAAATVWARVESLVGKVTPGTILAADIADLRACGLSGQKVGHLRSIAEAANDGSLNFRRLAAASDDEARAELVAVKGVGPWTADVYLIFCLGRPDVFPHADIGLSEAYRMILDVEARPPPREFLEIGERWRPYRGVAAHMLWSYINAARERPTGGA